MNGFESWIGKSLSRQDIVTPRLLGEFRATLDPHLFRPSEPDDCPPGFHWAVAPAVPDAALLGEDGAEARGTFLPPLSLPKRMWAGGALESFAPFRLGAVVTRTSTIAGVEPRQGRTGSLCFISIQHEFQAGQALLARERQDLVFRDGINRQGELGKTEPQSESAVSWRVWPTAVMLFRFSALTFNSHRIHYDYRYATECEGYGGLVMQGPLQAALLLNQACVILGRVPRRFEYRCLAPLIAGRPIDVHSSAEGSGIGSRIVNADAVVVSRSMAD